jgi:hypothetical protein
MDNDVIVALLALIGTLGGTFGGILTANKLTIFRIERLEEKVDKHNNFAERMPVVEEQIKVINHRLEDLEHGRQ